MEVGILGAGAIGQAFARQLARAGIRAVIGNSRGPDSLADTVRGLGPVISAGTREEVVRPEIVFLAVPWRCVSEALADLPEWDGRIIIDATNPVGPPDFGLPDLGGKTSSEIVGRMVPYGRLVKAFNTLPPEILSADPREHGGRRVIFYSGDHAPSKAEIARLINRLGFAGIDLGGLADGGRLQQFPGGPLPLHNLIRVE
jgi:predicted dinucleotide-binding enzyme